MMLKADQKEDITIPGFESTNTTPFQGLVVTKLNHNDVLCGRGGKINKYPGNVQFREICSQYQDTYISEKKNRTDKMNIISNVKDLICNMDPPGRFLEQQQQVVVDSQQNGTSTSCWVEINEERTRKKIGQVLREICGDYRKKKKRGSPQEFYDALSATTIDPEPCIQLLEERYALNMVGYANNPGAPPHLYQNNKATYDKTNHGANSTRKKRREVATNITVNSRVLSITGGDQRREKYQAMKMEESFNHPYY